MKTSTWKINDVTVDDIISDKANDFDAISWLRLIHQRGTSRKQKLASLIAHGGDVEAIVASSKANLSEAIQAEMKWLQAAQHYLLPITDPRYPSKLRQIPDPPLALYIVGDLTLLREPNVAIVGSRRPSPVGGRCAELIARELAQLGLVITSGLALGVDGIAHRGAFSAQHGKSIAVLAHGLATVYPKRHMKLFQQLVEYGLVMSEYPLALGVSKHHFPERNRIVSGLSMGVLIVEAAERSGTLITARLACEQDRELMVLPGSALSAQYRGSHKLIQQGAALVSNTQDVLACLFNELERNLSLEQDLDSQSRCSENKKLEHPLLEHIGAESTSIDEIIEASGLSAAEVSSELLLMEIQGQIATSHDGGYVSLR